MFNVNIFLGMSYKIDDIYSEKELNEKIYDL